MKTPIIIFLLGLTGLMIADFFNQVQPMAALKSSPDNFPEAIAFLDKVKNTTDLSNAPIVVRELSVGYIDFVDVNPGFRITHNPGLGKEVMVSAPEGAFGFLTLSSRHGRFDPDFDRPVRLSKLVEVELNLHAHGSSFMSILMSTPAGGRTTFTPDFVTKGPLAFTLLRLEQIPDHDLQIESSNLLLTEFKNLEHLRGEVERLEFLYRGTKEAFDADVDAPNVQRSEVLRSQVFFEL